MQACETLSTVYGYHKNGDINLKFSRESIPTACKIGEYNPVKFTPKQGYSLQAHGKLEKHGELDSMYQEGTWEPYLLFKKESHLRSGDQWAPC